MDKVYSAGYLRKAVSERRKERNITLEDLGKKVKVRAATLSDFENGKTQLGSNTLESIFLILGIVVAFETED